VPLTKLDTIEEIKKKVVGKESGCIKRKLNVNEHKLMNLGEGQDYLVGTG